MWLRTIVFLFTGIAYRYVVSQTGSCVDEPCQNGAICETTSMGYQCYCVNGFTGFNCSVNFDDCLSAPCKNNATCTDGVAQYTCTCLHGFTGNDCQTDIDECLSSPCLRGGTCINLIDAFACECAAPFRGDNCSLLPCDTDPCENEGLCLNDVNMTEAQSGFLCECVPGFAGPRCEVNIDDCDQTNATACGGNGLCIDGLRDYSCLCAPGWAGDDCQLPINDCLGNQCRQNATCIDRHLGYTCVCDTGYEGLLCEREKNECEDWRPCENGAKCIDKFNDYECECTAGWTGVNCTEKINLCDNNPCRNGGSCLIQGSELLCRCPPFHTGQLCETLYNPCAPEYNPCLNNADCVAPPDGQYRCFCQTGFSGEHCEVDVNECLFLPCENNGTCEDVTAGYKCHCMTGFTGQNCQINIDDCDPQPCLNGGQCVDQVNRFECNCTEHFTGHLCEDFVNYCLSSPCYHDGNCVAVVGGYRCSCPSAYTGTNCQETVDACESQPCFNEGTCINVNPGYTCNCPVPFTGPQCNQLIDHCASGPCLNGAFCSNSVDGFRCICPPFLTGRQCTELVDHCTGSPCANGATCINGINGYRCVCAFGFKGDHCEILVDFCSNDAPCRNSANCTNVPGGYRCDCPSGFSGPRCEISVTMTTRFTTSTQIPFSTVQIFPTTTGDSVTYTDSLLTSYSTLTLSSTQQQLVSSSFEAPSYFSESSVIGASSFVVMHTSTETVVVSASLALDRSGISGDFSVTFSHSTSTSVKPAVSSTKSLTSPTLIQTFSFTSVQSEMTATVSATEADSESRRFSRETTQILVTETRETILQRSFLGTSDFFTTPSATDTSNHTSVTVQTEASSEHSRLFKSSASDGFSSPAVTKASATSVISEFQTSAIKTSLMSSSVKITSSSSLKLISPSSSVQSSAVTVTSTYKVKQTSTGTVAMTTTQGIELSAFTPLLSSLVSESSVSLYSSFSVLSSISLHFVSSSSLSSSLPQLSYSLTVSTLTPSSQLSIVSVLTGVTEGMVVSPTSSVEFSVPLPVTLNTTSEQITSTSSIPSSSQYVSYSLSLEITSVPELETPTTQFVLSTAMLSRVTSTIDSIQFLVTSLTSVVSETKASESQFHSLNPTMSSHFATAYISTQVSTLMSSHHQSTDQTSSSYTEESELSVSPHLSFSTATPTIFNTHEILSSSVSLIATASSNFQSVSQMTPIELSTTSYNFSASSTLLPLSSVAGLTSSKQLPSSLSSSLSPSLISSSLLLTLPHSSSLTSSLSPMLSSISSSFMSSSISYSLASVLSPPPSLFDSSSVLSHIASESSLSVSSEPVLTVSISPTDTVTVASTTDTGVLMSVSTVDTVMVSIPVSISPSLSHSIQPPETTATTRSLETSEHVLSSSMSLSSSLLPSSLLSSSLSQSSLLLVSSMATYSSPLSTPAVSMTTAVLLSLSDSSMLSTVTPTSLVKHTSIKESSTSPVETSVTIATSDALSSISLSPSFVLSSDVVSSSSLSSSYSSERVPAVETMTTEDVTMVTEAVSSNVGTLKSSETQSTVNPELPASSVIESSSLQSSVAMTTTESPSCVNFCYHGGTCQMDGMTLSCICPPSYTGRHCEQVTDQPLLLHVFEGNQLIELGSQQLQDTLTVTLTFQTLAESGVLVYGEERTDGQMAHYLMLALHNGFLQYKFFCGIQTFELDTKMPVNTGARFTITLRQEKSCHATVEGSSEGNIGSLPVTWSVGTGRLPAIHHMTSLSHLYIAGTPQSANQVGSNFTGCLGNIYTNYQQFVPEDALNEITLMPCTNSSLESTLCQDVVCHHGASCSVTIATSGRPETHCNCPLHYTGATCQQEILLFYPSFDGTAFLEHAPPLFAADQSNELYISLTANREHGTILYSANQEPQSRHSFIHLTVENGFFLYEFSCDGVIAGEIRTGHQVISGREMQITVRQTWPDRPGQWCIAAVEINSKTYVGDPVLTLESSKPLGSLLVGGISQKLVSASSSNRSGFAGCIRHLQVNQREVDLVSMATEGINVVNCDVHVCNHDPCKNGATCHSVESEWYCQCFPGYGGALCERKLCHDDPCLHGGTCIVMETEGDQLCLCPYGRGGVLCEEALTVEIPQFSRTLFDYPSFLAYDTVSSMQKTFQLTLTFTLADAATSDSSLMLYMGDQGPTLEGDYMSVGLYRRYVVFSYDLGSGAAQIWSDVALDFSLPHHVVQCGRYHGDGWLQVDSGRNMTGRSPGSLTELNTKSWLYVGGLELSAPGQVPPGGKFNSSFSGCIFDLKIDAGLMGFMQPGSPPGYPEFGRSVSQCSALTCQPNPCHNGGVCMEMGSSFHCSCTRDWKGLFCRDRVTVCDGAHGCAEGATCLPIIPQGYRCACPLGKQGDLCQEDITVSDAEFNGDDSYMSFSAVNLQYRTDIRLQLKANSADSLLFYVAHRFHSNSGDFLSVSVADGYPELRYHLGSALVVVRSEVPLLVDAETWTTIEAGRNSSHGYLLVSDHMTSTMATHRMTSLDVSSDLYIGGLPSLELLAPTAVRKDPSGFKGCIRELVVNGRTFSLTEMGALSGRNIRDCDGTGCGYNVCQHEGTCDVISNTEFKCDCNESYYGNTCEGHIACRGHGCLHEGLCEPDSSLDRGYKCSCPLGWQGEFCHIEENFSAARLTGSGHLQYTFLGYEETNRTHEETSLSFKTSRQDGLLFWNGQGQTADEDYLGLGLSGGHLRLTWNLGWKSKEEILTAQRYHDNKWHSVTINRVGRDITMTVDTAEFHSHAPGDFQDLDTQGVFFIGGFPSGDTADKTHGLFDNSFTGCLADVSFYGNQPLSQQDFTAGSNVRSCDDEV